MCLKYCLKISDNCLSNKTATFKMFLYDAYMLALRCKHMLIFYDELFLTFNESYEHLSMSYV